MNEFGLRHVLTESFQKPAESAHSFRLAVELSRKDRSSTASITIAVETKKAATKCVRTTQTSSAAWQRLVDFDLTGYRPLSNPPLNSLDTFR